MVFRISKVCMTHFILQCCYPWECAHKKLKLSDNSEPSFSSEAVMTYFTNTYSNSMIMPKLRSNVICECYFSLFNTDRITPGLIRSTLWHCSKQELIDGIYFCQLSSTHHGTAPSCLRVTRIKLIQNGEIVVLTDQNFDLLHLPRCSGNCCTRFSSRNLLKGQCFLLTPVFKSGQLGVL